VVGGRPNGGIVAVLDSIALPSFANEQFCNPALLESNYVVPAYVPTAAERGGDFSGYAGLVLINPATGSQFSNNIIPTGSLDTVFAWRIPRHSTTLLQYACSIEPTLKSLEGNVTTSVQFQNQTTGTGNVYVYWINYAGQRVFYNSLTPNQSYVQQTYLTHPWVVTDGANNCLGIWLPTESPDTAFITGSVAALGPPTGLAATIAPSVPSVSLMWSPSAFTIAGYNVYRATVSGGPYTKLSSVSAAAVSFTDGTVLGGQTYYYVVKAFDSSNVESVPSNQVSAIVPVGPIFFGQATGTNAGGPNPDLVWGSVTTSNDGNVKLMVRFASGTFNNSTTAADFELDTDQNPSTGSAGSDSGCSNDGTVFGDDYFVQMQSGFASNQALIFKATGGCNNFTQIGTATVTIFTDGMDVTFPLTMLTNTASSTPGFATSGPANSGPWNFKVITFSSLGGGGFTGPQGYMPAIGQVASTASSPLPVTPPPSGGVAWWPADGYSTNIISGNPTTLNGGVSYAPSEVGQSFLFDGSTGYIDVTDEDNLTPSAVTVDFWFKSNVSLPDANHPEVPLISKLNFVDDANSTSRGYDFVYQFGALGFGLSNGGFRVLIYDLTDTTIIAGTWHHVAGTYDSTGQKLYFDGKLVNSGAYFGPITYQSSHIEFGHVYNTADFSPSVNSPTGHYYFNGQLDEIEVYNRALSASEIQAIYNAGSAGKAKP
jgi:hypothetical protein